MVLDRLAQSSARPVQPNAKGIAVQPHIGGHDFPILFTEIDPPDQFGSSLSICKRDVEALCGEA